MDVTHLVRLPNGDQEVMDSGHSTSTVTTYHQGKLITIKRESVCV